MEMVCKQGSATAHDGVRLLPGLLDVSSEMSSQVDRCQRLPMQVSHNAPNISTGQFTHSLAGTDPGQTAFCLSANIRFGDRVEGNVAPDFGRLSMFIDLRAGTELGNAAEDLQRKWGCTTSLGDCNDPSPQIAVLGHHLAWG